MTEASQLLVSCIDALTKAHDSSGIGAGEAAVIASFVAVAGTLLGSVLQNRWATARAVAREEREDRLHRERLAREDRFRFANERRAAYAEFMAGSAQVFARAEAQSGTPQFLALHTETNRAYMHVVVMADDETGRCAQRVWAIAAHVGACPSKTDELKPDFEAAMAAMEKRVRSEIALQSGDATSVSQGAAR